MSLFEKLDIRDSALQPYLNTGTLFDIQTGTFVPGTHGGMILNGGIGHSNAVMGRPQMFKSTLLFSYVMRVLSNYIDTRCIIDDTEQAQKKERLVLLSPHNNQIDLMNRIRLQTPADVTAEEFFEHVKAIAKEKLGHLKDYLVESPFLDARTGKPLMMLLPTIFVYDSWSGLMSGSVQSIYDTKQVGSSDTNMVYMRDGNVKKMILSQIPTLAARAGLFFCFTAHVGDKFDINPFAPTMKSLQYMKMSDKPKGVGSDFNFLISNTVDMRSVQVMLDGEKECQYPIPGGSDVELSEVTSVLCRCKNNMSGSTLMTVISQLKGVLSDLSNYHYIKKNDYYGLPGSKITHKPVMTDTALTRTTVREKLLDPKVARAVEIIAQLCYIQNNWMPSDVIDISINPATLAEKLLGSDSPTITDILESRSYWTYDKTNPQPYMSLYDILAISQGYYKAKGISLAGMKPKPVEKKS